MGSTIKLPVKKGIIRGTVDELKKYAKSKNIGSKRIQFDQYGPYIKAWSRFSIKGR